MRRWTLTFRLQLARSHLLLLLLLLLVLRHRIILSQRKATFVRAGEAATAVATTAIMTNIISIVNIDYLRRLVLWTLAVMGLGMEWT
jgi:hypothetical protein